MLSRSEMPPKVIAVLDHSDLAIAESLALLQRESDDHSARVMAAHVEANELRTERDQARSSFAHTQANFAKLNQAVPDDIQAAFDLKMKEIRAKLSPKKHGQASEFNVAITAMKMLPPGARLVALDPINVPAKPSPDDFEAALAVVRDLEKEIESTWFAPPPLKDVLAQIDSYIDGRAKPMRTEAFRAPFGMTIKGERRAHLTSTPRLGVPDMQGPTYGYQETALTFDVEGILAWLFGDALKQKIADDLKQHYAKVTLTIPRDKKAKLIADLESKLIEAQRVVEAMYRRCRMLKIMVDRPENLPWHVLLMCEPSPVIVATEKTADPAPVNTDNEPDDDDAWLEPEGAEDNAA